MLTSRSQQWLADNRRPREISWVAACSLAFLSLALGGANFRADPLLPTLFSDHMVFEQWREIHVWGKADPGESITASLGAERASATTDARGNWSIDLPPRRAGGPFTLSIRGKREIRFKDVMIGEVWIASGQSNMAFQLSGAQGAAAEIPNANHPEIRFFTVPKKIALSPQENTLPAHWEICTSETAKNFSAIAYFFAREMHRKLNVPVGVIESVWPGTAIEEWLAPDALKSDAQLKPVSDRANHEPPADQGFATNPQPLELEFDDFQLLPASSDSPAQTLVNFDSGAARLTTGGWFSYSWSDAPGTSFDLISPGHEKSGFAARVSGKLDGTQDAILSANYKLDGSATDLTPYAGIRFWLRGKGAFRFRSKQPTITDWDDYATSVMSAAPDWKPVTIWFRDLRQEGWGVSLPFTQEALTGFWIENLTSSGYPTRPPSGLYEGMIAPILPYATRGTLWYQGESNALRAYEYRKLLPALIKNWRDAAHQPEMEFLIVQLPNHGAIPSEPGESAWAELREAQLMTIKRVQHTGLAVTIDVGDPKDLHPHRKLEVGQRLALWALGTVYGVPMEYSGPLYESMQLSGGEARLHFSHIGGGLEAHGDSVLRGFAIAGPDRKFHWADARIDGDTVIVTSRDVPSPVAVRYAWGDSPACNLFNKDGLPASPFRTDNWPGITVVQQTNATR